MSNTPLTSTDWTEITLEAPPAFALDDESGAAILMELGAQAVETVGPRAFKAFVPASADDFLARATPLGFTLLSTRTVPEENWTILHEELLRPLRVGGVEIAPEAAFTEHPFDRERLFLVPGTGFGTGHHESTSTALLFLQEAPIRDARPKSALDVGTGSGILAIAAVKLFGAEVIATDIDPEALVNARENVSMNRVGERIELLEGELPGEEHGRYDLIIANIYAEVLVALEERLRRRIAPSGHLLLSGILPSLLPLVRERYESAGWSPRRVKADGSWCTIVFAAS